MGCGRIGTFVITVDIATEARTGVILGYALHNRDQCKNGSEYVLVVTST